jgi:hypothetical protein
MHGKVCLSLWQWERVHWGLCSQYTFELQYPFWARIMERKGGVIPFTLWSFLRKRAPLTKLPGDHFSASCCKVNNSATSSSSSTKRGTICHQDEAIHQPTRFSIKMAADPLKISQIGPPSPEKIPWSHCNHPLGKLLSPDCSDRIN